MSISGVQGTSTYTALSSGYKINSAADNASGLSISEKILSQTNGYTVGSDNAKDGINLINVADGALSTMQDSLQRIKELAVKASNGIYTDEDRQMIQTEIDQVKQSIQDTAKQTSFNKLTLLDGSMADIHLATNPTGGGLEIGLENSTLEALGIADFDVTGSFNIEDIDNAIDSISAARSNLGAQSNALTHTIRNNDVANYNLTSAYSSLKDTDYGEEMTKVHRDETMEKYRIFAMKAKAEKDAGFLRLF